MVLCLVTCYNNAESANNASTAFRSRDRSVRQSTDYHVISHCRAIIESAEQSTYRHVRSQVYKYARR
jgi:hypothetical protein